MSQDEEEREEHPSYGMVGFTRTVGNPGRLFGSPLANHESYITLRVSKGARIHSLGYDRFHGGLRGEILEVIMSAGQFAELITTMNIGSGVPCTIQYMNGKRVPGPSKDAELEVEKVRKGFKKDMQRVAERLKEGRMELESLLEKKTLTKDDKKRILGIISGAESHIEDTAPFMMEMFEEASEKVVKHAKAEIDAFVTHNVIAEGLRSIADKVGQGPNALPPAPPEEEP